MKPLRDMLPSLHTRSSLLETDRARKPSALLKIRHEKFRNEKFENLEMRV